jgi:signal transduction histidine kinase
MPGSGFVNKIFNCKAFSYSFAGIVIGIVVFVLATLLSNGPTRDIDQTPWFIAGFVSVFFAGIGGYLFGWKCDSLQALKADCARRQFESSQTTRTLDDILTSIPLAIFSMNADLTINSWHSSVLSLIVDLPDKKVFSFPEILGITDERVHHFHRWVGLVFGDFDVPWDSLCTLAPITEARIQKQGEWYHVAVTYSPLYRDGRVSTLMVILQDVSLIKNLESKIGQQQQQHEDELNEISEIIKLDYATFESFIFESKKIISESIKIIETLEPEPVSTDKINDMFRKMHTLKGNSHAFNFVQLGRLAHKVEDCFAALRDHKITLSDNLRNDVSMLLFQIEQKLDSIIVLAKSVMSGKDLGKVRTDNRDVFIRVKLEKVMNLVQLVQRFQRTDIRDIETITNLFDAVDVAVRNLRQCPAMRLLSRFPKMVKDLSVALGKNVNANIYGGEVEMDLDILDKMANAIVHMVRNAVDHGVEPPDQRSDAGKSFIARIDVKLSRQDGEFIFTVSDDGRGIDKNAILNQALEEGIVAERDAASMSDEQIFALVLQPGFTTAEKVTDISGRGIGMNVVAEILRALNGAIEIKSEKGVGSSFKITIPDSKPHSDFFSLDFAQDSAILTVTEANSMGSVNELRAIIYPVVKGEISRLYLNISRMYLVTSEFIGFLVTLNLLLKEGKKVLYIVNTNKDHTEALQLAHIDKMVEVIESI